MISIFLSNYYLISLTLPKHPGVCIYRDIDSFLESKAIAKFAIVEMTYEQDSSDRIIAILEKIKDIDHIIFRSVEVNLDVLNVLSYLSTKENASSYVNGIAEGYNTNPDLFWFYDTFRLYASRPSFLVEQLDKGSKPFLFEVLYGTKKPHRELVKTLIDSSKNKDLYLQSSFLETHSVYSGAVETESDWWEDDIQKSDDPRDKVSYLGYETRPSQIIPLKVYNKSAYSLVCETDNQNRFSFFTEKVAKPLIAGRLFIVVSGRHYLRRLRTLGFRTFDGIVDESYDEIADPTDRIKAAINSAELLIAAPQEAIQEKIKEIVEHNRNLMTEIYKTAYVAAELELEKLVHLADKGD
jgi:hypothetical protein